MNAREIQIPLERDEGTTAIIYEAQAPARRPASLVLAHGAGAGQRHPFMVGFARALSERGLDVVTFNFLYTDQGRRMPDRMPQLVACYRAVMAASREHVAGARERLFIGGKSMGGRVATHVAADDPTLSIDGIILLGYPLHPPGRPDQLRDAHLPGVKRPMLFVQGSRDAFGTPSELVPILDRLSPTPTLHVVEGGDHSFRIAGRDPTRQAALYGEIQDRIAGWIRQSFDNRSPQKGRASR
jgi:predicted alpha/beta-hydrolase family hydrolase